MSRVPGYMALVLVFAFAEMIAHSETAPDRWIRPWAAQPAYWQYEGKPVLLLGGSRDDNLFQIPDLSDQLDELVEAGGNFIRNTMSARQDGGFEVYPFKRLPDGRYDLGQWNDAYWNRFERCLSLCEARAIIVQIEVWDRFDYSQQHWKKSPWRPANNVNYTSAESGLANLYPEPAWRDKQPFFHTVPGMPRYVHQLDVVRSVQERLVAKMLSYSLRHGNILYCMNNETSTPPAWGVYWIQFIQKAAKQRNVTVYTTDMFDDGYQPWRSEKCRYALDHPERYTFLDISQINSRSFNEDHWKRLLWFMKEARITPRPVNHVKIYSDGETSWGSGTPVDGVERFWRNLLGGAAACRFHRPGGGIGLNDTAKACIAAVRRVERFVKFWDVLPMGNLLREREDDEAYLAAKPGEAYILFFTNGGSVGLDLGDHPGSYAVHWVNVSTGKAAGITQIESDGVASISAPAPGPWVAAIIRP